MEQRRHEARSQPSRATGLLPSIQELDAVTLMLEGPRERERLPVTLFALFLGRRVGPSTASRAKEAARHERSSMTRASVCSSQYVIPVARYIVVAVVRCSSACSRLPVRRESLPRPRWQWPTRPEIFMRNSFVVPPGH